MMIQLNPIEFATGCAVDLNEEINELQEMAEKAATDEKSLDEAMKDFRHLMSLLQGIEYMLHYCEDSDEKQQLQKHVVKRWRDEVTGLWPRLMELDSRRNLHRYVNITVCHKSDDALTVTVTVEDDTKIFYSREAARDYLRSLKK